MEHKTWDDIFREEDPDYDKKLAEANRNRRLEMEGCMIRAINSVLGVALTREQEDFRLKQIDETPDLLDILFDKKDRGEELDVRKETFKAIDEEHDRAISFLRIIESEVDTPAGRELRKFSYEYRNLTPDEICEEHKKGNLIVWADVAHAMHIIPTDENGTFRSLSDGKIMLVSPLNLYQTNWVIIFEPKKQVE